MGQTSSLSFNYIYLSPFILPFLVKFKGGTGGLTTMPKGPREEGVLFN